MAMIRYAFFISTELAAALKTLKQRDGIPESESIRRAVAEYLDRKGVKVTPNPRHHKIGPTETKRR